MNSYHLEIVIFFVISTLLGFTPSFLLATALQKTRQVETFVILVALCFVGTSAGIAGGMSREPAVGAIIPGFLALLSGVSLHLFGTDRSSGLIASFASASLSISLISAYTLSSESRFETDELHSARTVCATAFSNADLVSNPQALKIFTDQYGEICRRSTIWDLP